jgi:hypothetical protein
VRPLGDYNDDCLFNIGDVLVVAQYLTWTSNPGLLGNTTVRQRIVWLRPLC